MSDRRRVMGGDSLADKFVDLGLSVLWATGNICKDSSGNYYIGEPTEYGCYFSWGNIEGHNGGDGYIFNDSTYNDTGGVWVTDNIASNDLEHDAALAHFGGKIRMPTVDEIYELRNNCAFAQNYIGGRWGHVVTQPSAFGYSDKSIFLPYTGGWYDSDIQGIGDMGAFWSSTLYSFNYAYMAYCYGTSGFNNTNEARTVGYPIRPVMDKS